MSIVVSQNPLSGQLQLLKAAHSAQPYPSVKERLGRLQRLKNLLINTEAEFLNALSADYGYRAANQSSFADITTTIKSVNHAIRHLDFWMQSHARECDLSLRLSGARCRSEYVPKGVVGILSPWNFPINLALSPLVSVLSAGNRAFLKPSEITPRTAELLAQSISDYFDPEEIQVATGGLVTSQHFVALPFDHIIYTGGETVAKSIMKVAAETLVPLTLELGGKCPVLIGPDADVSLAASKIAFGKYFNAGQICIAPDYVLLARDKVDAFLSALNTAVAQADSSKTANNTVSIINHRHRSRLESLIADAQGKSGKVLRLPATPMGDYVLTVVIDPEDAEINHSEIFGPLLLIKTVESLEEQIATVNQGPHPLVIYYFGGSKGFKHVSRHTQSGAMVRNDIIFQYANDDLPFGGVGASGMGKYRGLEGFKEFSNHRAIYSAGWLDVSGFVTPPYPRLFGRLNALMRKL